MTRKLLYIANVGSIESTSFYISAAYAAAENEIEFHVAYNAIDRTAKKVKDLEQKNNLIFHQVDFIRNPLSLRNIKAYFQIVQIIRRENIDIIHCNTPIGGIVGRIAGKACGVRKIIYQAHGFHFYNGGPRLKNFIFRTIEKLMAKFTDTIITINGEDFREAQRFSLRSAGEVYRVSGVGIDTKQYSGKESSCEDKRREFSFSDNDIVFVTVGDLISRKNTSGDIKAVIATNNERIKLLVVGDGPEKQRLQRLIDANRANEQVKMLGRRSDVKEILQCSDAFLFLSHQEGLSRSLMEAMASGLPCVVSNIRGNNDLIREGKGGFLVNPAEVEAATYAINALVKEKTIQNYGMYNKEIIKEYDLHRVVSQLSEIYARELLALSD